MHRDAQPGLPGGFLHRPGFLSPGEEEEIRARLRALDYGAIRMRGFVARRKVASFGRAYAYDAREVVPAPPPPAFLLSLRARAAALAGLPGEALAMATASLYPPGAGIGWHRDAPAFGAVVGISLGGPARLQLRRCGAADERSEVLLAPGDAYVIAGPARWGWQHRVPPVRLERFAITFRTLRPGGWSAALRYCGESS